VSRTLVEKTKRRAQSRVQEREFNPRLLLLALLLFCGAVIYTTRGNANEVSTKKGALDDVLTGSGQSKELKGELLITATEERALAQLNGLLKKHKGTPLEVGLWFRKAELSIRRAKTTRFFEMNRETDSIVRFAPATVKSSSSKKHIAEGIAIYEKIQKQFKNFRDMDLVLFNNAFARQQINELNQAKSLYKLLLEEHPKSYLVPDTNLALGEMYYEEQNYKKSLEYLNAIRAFPDSNVYAYGLYKAAWAYYNNQNTAQALKNLEETVAFSRNKEKAENQKLDLKREALSDMVLFFTELYASGRAVSYFSLHAEKDEIGPLLLKLASLYSHHSKHSDLQIVLNEYIDKYPESKERPKAHYELINDYETVQNRVAVVKEMKRLRDVCAKRGGNSDVEDSVNCGKLLSGVTALLATKWHKMWMKDRGQEVLADSAEQAYDIFLGAHQNIKADLDKYVKGLYSQSDLLYQRKKFRQASVKYAQVSELTANKKSQTEALYSAIVSLEKATDGKWNDEDEKVFVTYTKRYISENPKGAFTGELRFKRAFIAYEKGRYDEAGTQFKELALQPQSDVKTLKAQDLYLDILNVKKDYSEIKKYSYDWMKKANNADRKSKLQKIYLESYFADIQRMEEKGELAEASKSYKIFASENASSNLSDKAMWNGVMIDYRLNALSQAASDGHRFYKMFPKSPKGKEALIKSAQTFEFLGQLKPAADVLEDLSILDSGSFEKWISLASDFRYLNGDISKSRAGYQKLTQAKDEALAKNAVLKLYEMEKNSRGSKSLAAIEKIINERRYEPLYGELRVAKIQSIVQAGNLKLGFQEAAEVLSDKKNSAKTLASARYVQSKILEGEFVAQSIITTPEKLSYLLKIKTEKLDKVLSSYQETIRFGDPMTSVMALRDLALCYDHYVKAIRNIHFTKQIPKEEMDALQAELEKVMVPMEDKAVETLAQAVQQAKRFNLRDGIIARIQMDLNKINLGTTFTTPAMISTPQPAAPYILVGDS
jgi:outer membrane protein assembly factor BamD (BamD/ComL family)